MLLIPFEVVFEGSRKGSSQESSIAIRWLGLTLRRVSPGSRAAKPQKAKAAKDGESKKTGFDPRRLWRILELLRDSTSPLAIIARSFRKGVSIKRVSIDVTFGLGDPAETALAAGYIWSVAWILERSTKVSLAVHPDMEALRLDGSVFAQLRVRLLPLASAFARAYLHKSFRSLIREVRSR